MQSPWMQGIDNNKTLPGAYSGSISTGRQIQRVSTVERIHGHVAKEQQAIPERESVM
jgi:hypothetical protein